MTEFHRSRLVQRLLVPHPRAGELGSKTDNPFAFGGGLRNGGLTPEAMDILRVAFRFDYMGSAEFEFGNVPRALQRFVENAPKYRRYVAHVDLATVPPAFPIRKDEAPPTGVKAIWFICLPDVAQLVEARILKWATEPYNDDLKEQARVADALRGDTEIGGWLELDNSFWFFTNETMYKAVADIFDIAEWGA